MKYTLGLMLVLFTTVTNAQTFDAVSSHAVYYNINAGAAFWKQDNLNRVLNANSLPQTAKVQFATTIGYGWTWSRSDLGINLVNLSSNKKDDEFRTSQSFVFVEASYKYYIPLSNHFSIAPKAAVAYGGGMTKIRLRKGVDDLNTVLQMGNAIEINNGLGYAAPAVIFNYGLSNRTSFYLETGYRIGFAASDWNTNEDLSEDMSNSVKDEVKQLYVQIGFKRSFLKKRK